MWGTAQMIPRSYNRSVFINCPFDREYTPLFRATVFAVARCGYYPRSALEEDDSSDVRMSKIFRIIGECRYGIHDLSRTESAGGFPRFNMPLELGVFLAAKHFGRDQHARKACLIFEAEPHSYERFISDIKGQDIAAHENQPKAMVRKIRSWLNTNANPGRRKRVELPGGAAMWGEYERFCEWLPEKLPAANLDDLDLDFKDYCELVLEWMGSGTSR